MSAVHDPHPTPATAPAVPAAAGPGAGGLSVADRSRLGRRAQLLAGASVAYNVIEAVIAISAGLVAGSVALVGFGLDSVVEVSSGAIILWQFRHTMPESRERQALRLMAFSFFALAAYVTFESVRSLIGDADPAPSTVGIVLAALSLAIMPFLSWAQRRTGKALGSNAVVADSTQTLLCTYLSGVLLIGLVLNATLGWSWADPIAGLIIAAVALKEGREAWRGEGCGCVPVLDVSNHPSTATTGGVPGGEGGCSCGDGCCGPTSATPTGARLVDMGAVRSGDGPERRGVGDRGLTDRPAHDTADGASPDLSSRPGLGDDR